MSDAGPSYPSPTRRLIRSYGLLVVIALAFLLMVMCVREKDKTVPAESIGSPLQVELTV